MAFVIDREKLKVYDPDRGLELISTGGGSDGRLGFKLVGRGFECRFDAYQTIRPATPVERAARPDAEHTAVWELSNAGPLIPGMSARQTYELLSEAILAAKYSIRHDEVNWAVRLPGDMGSEGMQA